jgi:beta-glucosidase
VSGFKKTWQPVIASLLIGVTGCGEDTNNDNKDPDAGVPTDTDAGTDITEPVAECAQQVYTEQPTLVAHTEVTGKEVITVDGKQFKDLNDNGALDPYEDWRLSPLCRAQDLVTKMSVPQKVGLMSEGSRIGGGTSDGTIPDNVKSTIVDGHVRQALIRLGNRTAQELAVYLNNIQELSESQPLGIPFVVTADPVHGFGMSTNGASGTQSLNDSAVVSPWPYPMGLGAANDAELTRQYGAVVREEFKAMGFRWQLGPMADLATEPRWARVQNTFGENAFHVAKHAKACVEGFQGSSTGDLRTGIAATIKHFPGAGPDENGMDSHSYYGRFNVYPGNNFEYHLIPFQAVFDSNPASLMACYSVLRGQYDYDPMQIPTGFSYEVITRLGKEKMGFKGMVTGDWGTATSKAFGMEALTTAERASLWLKAGSHQFGSDSQLFFQDAYDQGLVTEDEINVAASKILEMSFKLGIFENPYTNADATPTIVRSAENRLKGFDAQKRAIVLLKNGDNRDNKMLPIAATNTVIDGNGDGKVKVYFDGVNEGLTGTDALDDVLEGYDYTGATIVQANTLAEAEVAILRISARKGTYFGLDDGVPLSFDAPFPGTMTDTNLESAIQDRNRVIDAFRVRDGYTRADGTVVPAANPSLKIVLVMHMDRPGIVKPFINGLKTLDEVQDQPGSYPMVSKEENINATPSGGVDAFLVEFGAYDRAVLDFVFNQGIPAGVQAHGTARLPMEIPSSDWEVDLQAEDLPADTRTPTFMLGSGLNL